MRAITAKLNINTIYNNTRFFMFEDSDSDHYITKALIEQAIEELEEHIIVYKDSEYPDPNLAYEEDYLYVSDIRNTFRDSTKEEINGYYDFQVI